MGCTIVCCNFRNLYDLVPRHMVQVCITFLVQRATRDMLPVVHVTNPSASARLPGSTVALFSTLQPLFTGMLGLIGIARFFCAFLFVALPHSPYSAR